MSRRLPWQALMHAGLGYLRLSPESFWAMTPGELSAALGGGGLAAPTFGRGDLARLMAQHPDGRKPEQGEDR
jgi:uncharacterized phage protein (TIGR02216 family)